jgi:hypothetical protein
MLSRKEGLLLGVLPATIFLLGIAMYAIRIPIFAGIGEFDYDPAYVYLLSGVSLLNGFAPQHIDHPGTPMQMLCAALLAIYWLLTAAVASKSVGVSELALSQPEAVLAFMSHALLCMNVAATYFLGRTIYQVTGNWIAAALAQTPVLLLNAAFFHIMYLNGEALAIFATLVLLAMLARETLGAQEEQARNLIPPVLAGSMVALAVTAKVTFLPLMILLLSIRPWRRVRVSFIACVVVALLLLAPIWSQLPRFFAWIGGISIHSGRYATGDHSLAAWGEIPARIAELAAAYPASAITLFLLCVGVCCVVMGQIGRVVKATAYIADGRTALRVLLVVAVACVLQLAMVLKHFHTRYAIPTVLLSATGIIFVGIFLFAKGRGSAAKGYFRIALATVIIATGWHLYGDFVGLRRASQERASDLARIAAAIAQQERPLVIAAYRARDRDYALQFGLGYVKNGLTQRLLGVDHERWSYNRWNGKFSVAGITWKDAEDLGGFMQQGRTVLLLLPADVSVPSLRTETLVEIVGRERLLKVVGLAHD